MKRTFWKKIDPLFIFAICTFFGVIISTSFTFY